MASRHCIGRHPPQVGSAKLAKLERVSPRVRELAWESQCRLRARYRALTGLLKGLAVAEAHALGHLGEALRAVQSAPVPLGGRMHAIDKISGVDLHRRLAW